MRLIGFRNARGNRVQSPLFHIMFVGGGIGSFLYLLNEFRNPVYLMPKPPCEAPPAPKGVLSAELAAELPYARKFNLPTGVETRMTPGLKGEN